VVSHTRFNVQPEIVKFREMLDSRVQSQDQPLTSIPEEHKPLIVKLALERYAVDPMLPWMSPTQPSDKGIVPLAKQIRSILLPGPGEVEDAHRLGLESNLSLPTVEHAIKAVMTRINYGLDGLLGQKLPAAVCVWRWEVQDAYKDWLPKSARDSMDARLADRIQVRDDFHAVLQANFLTTNRQVWTCVQPSSVSLRSNETLFSIQRSFLRKLSTNPNRVPSLQTTMRTPRMIIHRKTRPLM